MRLWLSVPFLMFNSLDLNCQLMASLWYLKWYTQIDSWPRRMHSCEADGSHKLFQITAAGRQMSGSTSAVQITNAQVCLILRLRVFFQAPHRAHQQRPARSTGQHQRWHGLRRWTSCYPLNEVSGA
jgi:hypothetical protein